MNNTIKDESNVFALLAKRGHGKSAFMTEILYNDYLAGKKIITNYHVEFPHIRMSFAEIMLLPEELQDASVGLDELQVGASSRRSLSKTNMDINKFFTQLRKRNITLYYATQNFRFVDIDIRTQTDYIIYLFKLSDNEFKIKVVDRHDWGAEPINEFIWDATELFKKQLYDTNEIISFDDTKEED